MKLFGTDINGNKTFGYFFGKRIYYKAIEDNETRYRFLWIRWRNNHSNVYKEQQQATEEVVIGNHKTTKVQYDDVPDVSVIVPVFNASQYIRECLNSLIKQSDSKIEIICIDDCSTDCSVNIINEYLKKDKRIKLLTFSNNMGVAAARNYGISVAKGKFIGFVDPDDYVDVDYFGRLYKKARCSGADVVCTTKISVVGAVDQKRKNSGIDGRSSLLSKYDLMRIVLTTGVSWNKIYRSSFIKDKLILFPEIKTMGTDNYFTVLALALANKVCSIDDAEYFYRINPNSIIHKKKDETYFRLVDVYDRLRTRILNGGLSRRDRKLWMTVLEQRVFRDCCSNLEGFDNDDHKTAFIAYAKKHFPDIELAKFPEPIISLTTYPARISSVYKVVKTLKKQNIRVKKIILWLAKTEFQGVKDLPKSIIELLDDVFEIRWCENIRSYKKLIPALIEFPHDIIITADDDVLYPEDWAKRLIMSYMMNPDCIHCLRGRKIKYKNGNFESYSKWRLIKNPLFSAFDILPTGVSGVLYKRDLLDDSVLDEKIFNECCPTGDDIWFWLMALKKGTKIQIARPPLNNPNEIDTDSSLWEVNRENNNKMLTKVNSMYKDELKRLL